MRDTLDAPPTHTPERTALRRVGARRGSADQAAARLRAATRYYEQHVIAWHALSRLTDARAAHEAIARCRQELAAATHTQ